MTLVFLSQPLKIYAVSIKSSGQWKIRYNYKITAKLLEFLDVDVFTLYSGHCISNITPGSKTLVQLKPVFKSVG